MSTNAKILTPTGIVETDVQIGVIRNTMPKFMRAVKAALTSTDEVYPEPQVRKGLNRMLDDMDPRDLDDVRGDVYAMAERPARHEQE